MAVVRAGSREALAGTYDGRRWARSSRATMRLFERCGCTIHIEGAGALAAAGGPVVIVGNHMSMAETFILPGVCLAFREATFVVKQSLLDYPFFGPLLRARHPIAVSRANPREDLKEVLRQGQASLAEGRSVVVFPQATRSATFIPAQFNSLGVKLAARAGVPVVPLALKTDCQGIGRWIKDFGPLTRRLPMHFAFGAPLDPRGQEKATHAAVVSFIRDHLTDWGGVVKEDAADGELPKAG
ncbi:MAG: 1-acyl-sn-glycerol-3-phosphate acyltransferase [Lentisphaerae bacterium]|nr:1-acyl-sn-glycerol-3-phosphate acyltransferase [Lentisphaerota bacterium]